MLLFFYPFQFKFFKGCQSYKDKTFVSRVMQVVEISVSRVTKAVEISVSREFVSKVIKGQLNPQNILFLRVFNSFFKGFDPRKKSNLLYVIFCTNPFVVNLIVLQEIWYLSSINEFLHLKIVSSKSMEIPLQKQASFIFQKRTPKFLFLAKMQKTIFLNKFPK